MTDSKTPDSDLATLQDDMAALKRDIAGLVEHLKAAATTGARDATTAVDDTLHGLYRSVAANGDQTAAAIGKQIKDHTLVALLIAAGLGYVGGRLLSR